MKKITLITLLISFLGYGQFFESENSEEEQYDQSGDYSQNQNPPSDPDQGVDAIGNPGEPVPINNGWWILPIAGFALGVFYLTRKRKLA